MPGKVNPSVPEMVNQVCFQVMGCDTTVALAVRGGPARAERDDAGHRLERAARVDDSARVDDGAPRSGASTASPPIAARARELLDRSTATATALSPYIGYAATAEIAKESVKTGRSIRDLVLERGLLDADAAGRDSVGRGDDDAAGIVGTRQDRSTAGRMTGRRES